ncbi:ABC transporter permease [Micromonospora aurantiaca]|uniref:ABC transporter permease n=1 Tax=Micromonospora aurantiaca (nom. illeg.) TaxID=47850 RepID=UPI0033C3CF56
MRNCGPHTGRRPPSVLEVCRTSAGEALVPALDQTPTVGLVTLPGAFVGVLRAAARRGFR